MIKTLQNTLKQDKEKFTVPRSVQDTIPIRRIWPDGIFQFGSKFSKCIRFSDINYAIASKEDRTAMFLNYSELLNALGTGSTTKITLNNKRINRQNFEETILLPPRGDFLDGYRAEYNAMLTDKVTDASNSVVQERYITISTHKKNIEEARTFFDRVTNDVTSRLSHMDSRSEELDAVERLRVLHDFYRVGEETEFRCDLLESMRKGHSFKDAICPDSMEFKKDHFVMGGKFGRVLFLKEYASYIKDSMINELTELNRTMMLSIDVIPVPTDEAVREMQNRLLGVETNVTNWQRRQNSNNNFSAVVPYDLEQQRKETREMLDDLTTRDQRMMFAVVTLVHLADSKEELDSDTETLQSIARKHLCQLNTLNWQQADGLVTALPLGLRRIDALRTLTTEALAVLMPFKAQEIRHQGGVYYGQNAISKNLILANRWELLNANGFVLGVSGSGKSFTAKREIVSLALATGEGISSGDDIIVIDPESEYGSNSHGHWTVCSECGKHSPTEDHTPQLVTVTAPNAAAKTDGEGKYVCEDCGYVMETGVVIPYEVPAHDHVYSASGLCTVCGKRCDTMWFARQPKNVTVTVPDVGLEEQLGMTVAFTVKPRDAKGHTEEDFFYYWEAGYVKPDGTCDFKDVEDTYAFLVPQEIRNSNPDFFQQSTLILSVPTDICCGNIRVRCRAGLYNEETGVYDYEMYSDTADLIGRHSYKYQDLPDGGSKSIQMTPGGSNITHFTSAQHQKICVGEGCGEALGTAAAHNYNGWLWVYGATADHTGLKYRACKDCGYKDYVVIPKLDASHVHSFVYKYNETVHWQECSGCGAKQVLDKDGNPVVFPAGMEPEEIVYKSSHIYGDWVRTTEPTEDELGKDTATCKVCGYAITRDVDKLPHTHEFYNYDEYFQYAFVKAYDGWHVTKDAKGNPASGDFYYAGEKVLGGDGTGHWFYCKGEMCEQKGYLHPHRMSAWNVVEVPTATDEGAAYGECLDCGFWSTKPIPAGGYPIGVQNGESFDAAGKPVAGGTVGQTITIKASQIEGKKFDHWEVMSGGVILANANASETTFVVKSITPAHDPALLNDYTINIYGEFTACTHTSTHTGGAIDPTCGANGKTEDTICDECGAVVTEGTPIPATGDHNYQIDPKTVKTGDCTHTGYSGDYVCTVCGKEGETGTRTGRYHANTETTGAKAPTCTVAGYTGTTVCTVCGAIVSKGDKIEKTPHSFSEWVVTTAPTFDKTGKETRTCELCGKTETQTIPATGKFTVKFNSNGGTEVAAQSVASGAKATVPDEPTKSNSTFQKWHSNKALTKAYDFAAPVTANLTLYAEWTDPELVDHTITVQSGGNGSVFASTLKAKAGTTVVLLATPDSGYQLKEWQVVSGGVTVSGNKFTMPDADVTVKAIFEKEHAHTFGTAWTSDSTYHWHAATCGHDVVSGKAAHTYGGDNICDVCGYVKSGSFGGGGGGASMYAITVESAKNGAVTASAKSAAKGDTVTLTVTPDKGYTLETLTATDSGNNKLTLTEKSGKYTFTMPASNVTVKATFMEDNSMLNFFVDVPADAYYYDAVLWAAEEGITGGVDDTHFAPNASCTRAQAVTFLWRAAGSPAPKSSDMPFTDVAAGSYYETAVLWAVENGITKGTSDTTFSPNDTCSRAQIVTFLWRAQKSPAAGSVNPFTDVAADVYYTSAVLWAVENGITGGTTATTFSPASDCTRAQIVTFLFRCLGK